MNSNKAAPQMDTAEIFAMRWRDAASGAQTISLVHTKGHGATDMAMAPGEITFDTLATNTIALPGSEHAIAIRGSDDCPAGFGPAQIWCDNDSASPCTSLRENGTALDVIEWDWLRLREQFPNAKIIASTHDAYFEAISEEPKALTAMPLFEGEIGDGWCAARSPVLCCMCDACC